MVETISGLSTLATYGIAGVCLGLIGLLAFVLKCVFENTKATQGIIQQASETQQKLVDIVAKDAEKTAENTEVLRALKTQLEICNAAKK
jgi:hypothetical protein